MKQFIKALPVLSIVLALALDALLPDNLQHPAAEHPYFAWLLITALVLYLIFYIASFARPALREKLEYKALFYAGAALFFNILNLLTVKFAVLPVLYFPSLDRVFGVLVEDSTFLAKCLAYSARLLLIGWFCGALVGMLAGIAIGFSKTFSYWVQPLVRVLGPIPSTAWIPIVLIAFPSAVSASAFLIALAVWFPTTVLTNSGIASIPNSYFEVSSTLGAGSLYRIVKVGIPAAMPHMFLGLFNGTCSSFITLVTAEMLGAKYGIGRDMHIGDTIIGIKGRVGFEAAAPMLIIAAHKMLEKHTLTKWQTYWKDQVATWYGMFLHEAQYLEPVMRDIEAMLLSSQRNVTGTVELILRPRNYTLVGVDSTFDLMKTDFGEYGEVNKAWTADDVKGFTKILGNQIKIFYNVQKRNKK
mgnify:CR=1 FL=1